MRKTYVLKHYLKNQGRDARKEIRKKTGEQMCHNVCHLFHINTAEHKENNQEEQNTTSGLKYFFHRHLRDIYVTLKYQALYYFL